MGQILLRAFVGAAAGLGAWAVVEPLFPRISLDPSWARVEKIFMLVLGGAIGASLGALHGWLQGSNRHLARGLLLGAALGALGGFLGYAFGGAFLSRMFPPDVFSGSYPLGQQVVARVVAITPIGLFLGTAIGVAGLTGRRIAVGAIGGFIGGLASGALFDLLSLALAPLLLELRGGAPTLVEGVPTVSGEIGIAGRAATGLAIGLFIGLFIGIVDRVTRTSWIRLVLGRNEGREWVVDASQTFLGRSEGAHVPLHGDPNVAPMHACIARQGQTYVLMDGGSPIGTFLHGQRIQQAPLFDGAQIQIGPHVLLFSIRQGSAPQRASEAFRGQPVAPQPAHQTVPQATIAAPAAAVPGGFILVATDGPLAGQRFDIRASVEVGRDQPSLPLSFDASVSRRHATLSPSQAGIALTDLGSTNGTFVNGQRVRSATIRPGDLVKIGATTFRVE